MCARATQGTFKSHRVRRCAASGPLIRPGDEAEELGEGVEVEVKVRRGVSDDKQGRMFMHEAAAGAARCAADTH